MLFDGNPFISLRRHSRTELWAAEKSNGIEWKYLCSIFVCFVKQNSWVDFPKHQWLLLLQTESLRERHHALFTLFSLFWIHFVPGIKCAISLSLRFCAISVKFFSADVGWWRDLTKQTDTSCLSQLVAWWRALFSWNFGFCLRFLFCVHSGHVQTNLSQAIRIALQSMCEERLLRWRKTNAFLVSKISSNLQLGWLFRSVCQPQNPLSLIIRALLIIQFAWTSQSPFAEVHRFTSLAAAIVSKSHTVGPPLAESEVCCISFSLQTEWDPRVMLKIKNNSTCSAKFPFWVGHD